MAANPKSLVDADSRSPYTHFYHAEAHVFSSKLDHPIRQPLESYGRVVLEKSRRQSHIAQKIGETSIEGLISFGISGHTRVIGAQIKNKTDAFGNDHAGWVTMSTAVLEGLNVVDILTADRVVAQVSTEHPVKDGNVPKVTFLGTHFENLRIGGYPVEVEIDLGICGNKPGGDRPYVGDERFSAVFCASLKTRPRPRFSSKPGKAVRRQDFRYRRSQKAHERRCEKGSGTATLRCNARW